ncbi:hypothetical protein [Qipengyuania sp. JC766]|uniref:hypothetical protein n=1 Tax=Qipengyuania sp. JC766 TaxID=3232139 RepID=UPI00345B3FFE
MIDEMRNVAFLAALILNFYGAHASASDCAPRFTQSSQTVTVSATDIGVGGEARENFQIRVQNEGKGECSATLRLARQGTSTAIRYVLTSGGQFVEVLPADLGVPTARSDVFVPGVPSGANGRAVPFRLTFATEWGLESGQQREEILVSLVDEQGVTIDTMSLYFDITVPSAVDLRIVGATGANAIAEVDLGDLEADRVNVSDPFAVRIWSTSPYSVSFQSEGNGALIHRDGASRIAYSLRMNGTKVDLTGIPRSFGRATGPLGEAHPLLIEVQPFIAEAGDYGDRISVTVTAG